MAIPDTLEPTLERLMQRFERTKTVHYTYISGGTSGKIDLYVKEIRRSDSPVLELGCRTGRLSAPISLIAHQCIEYNNFEIRKFSRTIVAEPIGL